MDPLSYKEAKAQGKLHYWTGKPCKFGHVDFRYVRNCQCMTCSRLAVKASNQKHRAKRTEYQRRRREDPEKRAKHYQWTADYIRRNPHKACAYTGKRRALKLRATPSWLTQEHLDQMQAIYAEAQRRQDQTGIPHHVDHIEPLQGKNFCGLHVPWNLQVLTATENQSKGNRRP